MSRIAVVGVGYVGLCTSAGFAKLGHQVRSFDVVADKIAALTRGDIPIYEPGLETIVHDALAQGNLTFLDDLASAVAGSEFVFVCVPTPQDEDGTADLSYVLRAVEQLRPLMPAGSHVIVKSTVPVGASARVQERLARDDVHYVSNPEFLREGSAMWDFFNPDRIVVGSVNRAAAEAVASLYQQPDIPTVVTTPTSAELIKYASNAFLAMKLSFMNEVAAICERAGANSQDVAEGFGLDSRIGRKFLNPGPGWGGSCFPKDTRALLAVSEQLGVPSVMVEAAVRSNENSIERVVERLASEFNGDVNGRVIAAWGIAFKAHTDDIRESPAVEIIRRLAARGATVQAYDPIAALPAIAGARQASTAQTAVAGADALIVLTEWPEFSEHNAADYRDSMNAPIAFDTRHVLNDSWDSMFRTIRLGHAG